MKKILTIFFLLLLWAGINLGQAVFTQSQQEFRDFFDGFNNDVRRFCFIAAS